MTIPFIPQHTRNIIINMLLLYSDNLSSLFQAVLRRAFNGQVHVLTGTKMVSNFVTKSDLRKKFDKIPRIITLTDKGRPGTHVILRGAGSLAMAILKKSKEDSTTGYQEVGQPAYIIKIESCGSAIR